MDASRDTDTSDYGWGLLPPGLCHLTKLALSGHGRHVDTASLVACRSLASLQITYHEFDPGFDEVRDLGRDPTVEIARALLHPCFSQQLTEFRYYFWDDLRSKIPDSHGMLIASLAGLQRLKCLELCYSIEAITQFSLLMPTLASLEIVRLGTTELVPSLLSVLRRQPNLKYVSFDALYIPIDTSMVSYESIGEFARQVQKHCDFFNGITSWASE